MNFKNLINLKGNQNFLFNLLLGLTLLKNFDISITPLIAIITSLIIIYNYKNIELNNKAFLSLFVLTTYIIFLYLFNSSSFSSYLIDIKFWFSFLFVILIYNILNLNFTASIIIFRFLFFLFLLEFIIFNFLPNYNDIFITQNSINQWFGYFRVIGFARNTSVSGGAFVFLFIYCYQYKAIKSVDWIFLLLGLIMLFSATSFLFITIFFIYFLFKKTKNKIPMLKKIIVLFFLIFVFVNMPIKQHSSKDSLKIINYQKISKSYYIDNIVYKFNNVLCYFFELEPLFNYEFSDYSLKISNSCFVLDESNFMRGTSLDGDIFIGGDNGWLLFFYNFGVVGSIILLFSLRFYKKNDKFYLTLLVLFNSFHYFALANFFSIFFIAMLLNERKLIK